MERVTLSSVRVLFPDQDGALQPGVKLEDIERFASETGVLLPDDYVAFLQVSNGLEGAAGESSYIRLWPVNDLVVHNRGYRISTFAPNLYLIGTDGGDIAYGFRRDSPRTEYIQVPFI